MKVPAHVARHCPMRLVPWTHGCGKTTPWKELSAHLSTDQCPMSLTVPVPHGVCQTLRQAVPCHQQNLSNAADFGPPVGVLSLLGFGQPPNSTAPSPKQHCGHPRHNLRAMKPQTVAHSVVAAATGQWQKGASRQTWL
uniref:TRAF-type domain-containing protein n=1 Tax=Eutreptiella gymnastica TaxID=73025 RepID=A0A7S4G1N5_9EUGL|mmetsp:Transcript_14003/g.22273  ORF Transcript_14003/g.22273 Transcript_14003/m.22273 type:complete len:138 (+) Transcript_14003:233-646(+)